MSGGWSCAGGWCSLPPERRSVCSARLWPIACSRPWLFEVSPTDAPTLGLAALILLSVAALASLIPTRSSTRIDPVVALRAE